MFKQSEYNRLLEINGVANATYLPALKAHTAGTIGDAEFTVARKAKENAATAVYHYLT